MKFNPGIGEYVVVCYDGKLYRQTTGRVLDKQSEDRIKVEFVRWGEEEDAIVIHWFERTGENGFGSVFVDDESLGSLAYGLGGDWYSVFDIKYRGLNGFLNPIKDFIEISV